MAIAVCIFTDGCEQLGEILEATDITVGTFAVTFFEDKDVFRIISQLKDRQRWQQRSPERERG